MSAAHDLASRGEVRRQPLRRNADESARQGLENDPRRWADDEEDGQEMGEDRRRYDDMVDRLDAGQSPEEIESRPTSSGYRRSPGMDDDL
jgi:hypothetical protein